MYALVAFELAELFEPIESPFPVVELIVTLLAILNTSFDKPKLLLNSSVVLSKFKLVFKLKVPLIS